MEKEFNNILECIAEMVADKLANKISLSAPTSEPKTAKKLTRKEVAEMLHISLPTLHSYINKGLVCPQKIGGRVLFDANEVEEAMATKVVFRYKHS